MNTPLRYGCVLWLQSQSDILHVFLHLTQYPAVMRIYYDICRQFYGNYIYNVEWKFWRFSSWNWFPIWYHILYIHAYISYDIVKVIKLVAWALAVKLLRSQWMWQNFTNENSTLVKAMPWCRQATSYCLSQCLHGFIPSYMVLGATMNKTKSCHMFQVAGVNLYAYADQLYGLVVQYTATW